MHRRVIQAIQQQREPELRWELALNYIDAGQALANSRDFTNVDGQGWFPVRHENGFVCEFQLPGATCGAIASWHNDVRIDRPYFICNGHYHLTVIETQGAIMAGQQQAEAPVKRMNCWELANVVMPHSKRTLLHGVPGTGKTRAGMYVGTEQVEIQTIYITEYTSVTEPRGNIFPVVENGERIYRWQDGPAVTAYRYGQRLVINEIDKASDDCITFFLNLLDDEDVSRLTLPTGEILKPHENFSVVATMNGNPGQLIEALRDRFPVSIYIGEVNPDAVNTLSEDLRQPALATAIADEARRKSIRGWKAFDDLRQKIPVEEALWAVFGRQAPEMLSTLKLKASKEARATAATAEK